MGSGSKYEILLKATQMKLDELSKDTSDVIKQKLLEAKVKRIDKETEAKVKSIKNTPVDTNLLKMQAEIETERLKRENEAEYQSIVDEIDDKIKEAEHRLKASQEFLDGLKRNKDNSLKKLQIERESEDKRIQCLHEQQLKTLQNTEKTIQMKIEQLERDSAKQKAELEIEIENLKIKNEAKDKRQKEMDKLYEDVKKIGIAIGDAK